MKRELARVILVGAGRIHLRALHAWPLEPRPAEPAAELELTLISESAETWPRELREPILSGGGDPGVDVERCCARAGVRFLQGRVVAFDPVAQNLHLQDGRKIAYDFLSFNCGTRPDASLVGGEDSALHLAKPTKALHNDLENLLASRRETAAGQLPLKLTVLGGGALGCETAALVAARIRRELKIAPSVTLIESDTRLLPEAPPGAGRDFAAVLRRYKARILLETRVKALASQTVTLTSGLSFPSDLAIAALPSRPESWLTELPLRHVERGFLEVNRSLETSLPKVFAVGSNARFSEGQPLGASADAQARVLLANLAVRAGRFSALKTLSQRAEMEILSDGEGRAVAYFGGFHLPASKANLWLKKRRDARFLKPLSRSVP